MNEEKNIETCLAESILAEVASVPQDPQFRSLVNESLDPLQQAGSDAYKEVVWTHKPYTFTSSVRQMKSNLILLLRRLWRFPFGRGTIRSFADMWQHYITRLSGNPEYGIPSRLDQLTDLPSAPLLLSDRKITNGGSTTDGIPDGVNIMRLICSPDSASVTKLVDDSKGWVLSKENILASLLSYFPNATEFVLGCKSITTYLADMVSSREVKFIFTDCQYIYESGRMFGNDNGGFPNAEVHIYGLKTTNQTINNPPSLLCGKVFLHDYEYGTFRYGGSGSYNNNVTRYIYLGCKGKPTDNITIYQNEYGNAGVLTDIEIRDGTRQRLTISNMLTGLTAENIVNHIFDRLADNTDGDPITINIGSTNRAKLTAEQIAIATNKNYTLA